MKYNIKNAMNKKKLKKIEQAPLASQVTDLRSCSRTSQTKRK